MGRKKKLPNVEQLKNGLWRYDKRITLEGQTYRVRSTGMFGSAEKAHAALVEDLEFIKKHGVDAVQNHRPMPRFGDLAREWIDKVVPATCKASTAEDYHLILDKHVLPEFASAPVDQITKKKVRTFLLGKISAGRAVSTAKHMQAVIAGVLKLAVEDDLIPANPARDLGRLGQATPPGHHAQPFTRDELAALLGVMADHWPRYYPLILTLARTGMRLGEALALKWEDIDFRNRRIHIQRSRVRGRVSLPKSGLTRKVDMSPQLTQTLQAFKVERKREALARGWGKAEWIFLTTFGNPVDRSKFRSMVWIKALAKVGLSHHRLHDLRHTYATLRLGKGDNLVDVSHQLGHGSTKITLDTYTHWIPGQAPGEVDGLDDKPGQTPNSPYFPTVQKAQA